MANRTEKDAFERIVKAKMGSLAGKPTTEYLEALKAHAFKWAQEIENELNTVYFKEPSNPEWD